VRTSRPAAKAISATCNAPGPGRWASPHSRKTSTAASPAGRSRAPNSMRPSSAVPEGSVPARPRAAIAEARARQSRALTSASHPTVRLALDEPLNTRPSLMARSPAGVAGSGALNRPAAPTRIPVRRPGVSSRTDTEARPPERGLPTSSRSLVPVIPTCGSAARRPVSRVTVPTLRTESVVARHAEASAMAHDEPASTAQATRISAPAPAARRIRTTVAREPTVAAVQRSGQPGPPAPSASSRGHHKVAPAQPSAKAAPAHKATGSEGRGGAPRGTKVLIDPLSPGL